MPTHPKRLFLSTLITAHLALFTLPVSALEPITPPGGQLGTSVTITLKDNNIASFQELVTYRPGLSLTDLKLDEKDKTLATAVLHIAPDAALGEHPIRIRTAHDISYLRSFWVGPFPDVTETEPNNHFDEAQRVKLNTTVQGIITLEDEDTFIVSLKKGQRLSVEAEAMRLGRVLFDAHIAILDPRKFELAACDDSTLHRQDPFLSVIAPENGDYRIVIREAAYEGSEQSAYRLHIGTFPRPPAVFPLAGKPGETIEFSFPDSTSHPLTKTITLPTESTESFPIFPDENGETSPSPHLIRVSSLEHSPQPETNITQATAHSFPAIPSAVDGILDGNTRNRWFKFSSKKNQNLEIRALARSLRSPLDSVLVLRDSTGKGLENNDDDQQFPDSLIKWTCTEDGEYFLQLRDQLGRTGPDFAFRIEITRRQPAIAATMPTTERNDSQKDKFFPVPRGNRYAAVIQLKRENIGCDITFTTENLPPGIRMFVPEIPRSLNNFPVVFEADAAAPLGSSLPKFTIRATGEKVPENLTASLTDTVHHIEVNNEGTYHSHTADRIATAVIEAVPFSIELEPPSVPIVRNGKLMLKTRVSRSDGFKGKITTRFLWNPAGISGPANVEIPPEKHEAEYELNASADAATGTWQVCVVAEADTPNGRRIVSSSLVPLVIAEPYLTFTLNLAAGQIGKPSALVAKIDQLRDFQGQATAELLSLPHGVTSKPVSFTKDQQEITFPLDISADAKPGKTTSLLCKVLVPENNGQIQHLTGQGGTLRIDAVPKTEALPAKKPSPEVAGNKPAAKPLSRLEQLRQKK